jgi:hypothetical protein
MKKLVALSFALILVFTTAAAALAESTKGFYDSTRQFIATLDENEMTYTYEGVDNNDYDIVNVAFTGDNTDVTVKLFFNSDGEDCGLRVWYLIEYDEAFDIAVCRAVNTLNQNYRFIHFFADTDYSVTAAMDVIFHAGDDIGAICYDAMLFMADICDTAYLDLEIFIN